LKNKFNLNSLPDYNAFDTLKEKMISPEDGLLQQFKKYEEQNVHFNFSFDQTWELFSDFPKKIWE
jgi:hypothetical protein